MTFLSTPLPSSLCLLQHMVKIITTKIVRCNYCYFYKIKCSLPLLYSRYILTKYLTLVPWSQVSCHQGILGKTNISLLPGFPFLRSKADFQSSCYDSTTEIWGIWQYHWVDYSFFFVFFFEKSKEFLNWAKKQWLHLGHHIKSVKVCHFCRCSPIQLFFCLSEANLPMITSPNSGAVFYMGLNELLYSPLWFLSISASWS